MRTHRFLTILLAGFTLLVAASCIVGGSLQSKGVTPTPKDQTPGVSAGTTEQVSPTTQPGAQPTQAPTEVSVYPAPQSAGPSPEAPAGCEKKTCIEKGTFLLGLPIGPKERNTIDTASRYGTLRKRVGDVYHGVQFLNSTGVPVLAAADGDVEVAGDDSQTYYGPRLNMYGNLVILKHKLPGISEPVYTLYAHLSKISVKAEGDVKAGEQIGLVGMTGSTRGSTLYFEVRVGKNSYDAARNPELWLQPLPDKTGDPMGSIAGQVVDKNDDFVHIRNILVENVRTAAQGKIRQIYLRTYIEDGQMGLSPWGETFAAGYMPEGTYQISFWYRSKLYQREVEVQPGMLTFLTFTVSK